MNKLTFWEYLKQNYFWLFVVFTMLMILFWVYWVVSTGWDFSRDDIMRSGIFLIAVWIAFIVGSVIDYKKL